MGLALGLPLTALPCPLGRPLGVGVWGIPPPRPAPPDALLHPWPMLELPLCFHPANNPPGEGAEPCFPQPLAAGVGTVLAGTVPAPGGLTAPELPGLLPWLLTGFCGIAHKSDLSWSPGSG